MKPIILIKPLCALHSDYNVDKFILRQNYNCKYRDAYGDIYIYNLEDKDRKSS